MPRGAVLFLAVLVCLFGIVVLLSMEPRAVVSCSQVQVLSYQPLRRHSYYAVRTSAGSEMQVFSRPRFVPGFQGSAVVVTKRGRWTGKTATGFSDAGQCPAKDGA
jgi:hypothetical protein